MQRDNDGGNLNLPLKAIDKKKAMVHGHCHQKAFGYEAEHYDVSMKMAEMDLLPAVREAEPETIIVADGTSCRHQVRDGANREAKHVAKVLSLGIYTR